MKLALWIVLFFAILFGGGFALLSSWNIPAPSSKIEQVIPNDRFPR